MQGEKKVTMVDAMEADPAGAERAWPMTQAIQPVVEADRRISLAKLFGSVSLSKLSFPSLSFGKRGRIPATLLGLTVTAILVHGYHVGVEDQDVYLSAIRKRLDPSAYPFNGRFFTEQMKGSAFVPAVALTARLLHSVQWALLLWQTASIFLILLGCWKLAQACFDSESARWAGVLLVTLTLTLPIAGTALYPVDQYLNPRAPATVGVLFALVASLNKQWWRTVLWLMFAAAMHPLMALFGASLVVFVAWPAEELARVPVPLAAMILPLHLWQRPSEAWKAAALARSYYFPLQWTWYEWLGLAGPVLLVWWFARIARQRGMATLERLATRLFAFAIFQFAVAALMTIPPASQQLAALQPMRWLHIFYFVFLLMAGGLLGQFMLRREVWRWVVLFLPLAAGMFYVQRQLFQHSDHVELPRHRRKNPWAKAFVWSRHNTPKGAVFAIVPDYMELQAEDSYGFRALAERSLLAENQKDPGAATVFPDLAPEWQQQMLAQKDIDHFNRQQFAQLKRQYNVTWTVLPVTARVPLECPYRNDAAQVCRVD
jgi:hypothetical protein